METYEGPPQQISERMVLSAQEQYPAPVITAVLVSHFAEIIEPELHGQLGRTDDEIVAQAPGLLNELERKAQLPGIPHTGRNHVLITGTPAAGKTSLAMELAQARNWAPVTHYPTAEILGSRKQWSFNYNPANRHNRTWEDEVAEAYIHNRLAGAIAVVKDLHSKKGEQIVVGGLVQTLSTIAAYFKLYEQNRFDINHAPRVPQDWIRIAALAPLRYKTIVFADAPLEERLARAEAQCLTEGSQYPLDKRITAFEHDSLLRQLTIDFLVRLAEYQTNTLHMPTQLIYYPTANEYDDFPLPFVTVSDTYGLNIVINRKYDPTEMYDAFALQERMI